MSIEKVSPQSIQKASSLILDGEVVAFPTETVYGLGGNLFDPMALAKIFEVKNRPHFDPLIAHVSDFSMAEEICETIPDFARDLMNDFWPGPLTLVLPKKESVPDLATSGLSSVAVRMPAHDAALALIRACGKPLAAPSANPFGYLSPTTAEHVSESLGCKIPMILDGGSCHVGIESTILDFTKKEPVVLRLGGFDLKSLEKRAGKLNHELNAAKPAAPGQLEGHYSPLTPLKTFDSLPREKSSLESKVGLLSFQEPDLDTDAFSTVEVLSVSGNLREAAANLFSAMHRLDHHGLDEIWSEKVPEEGLGRAINDRLTRAEAMHRT